MLMSGDSDAADDEDDDDDDDDDGRVDSLTGSCLASKSQLSHLPDTQLQFHKCTDVNADRPAKVGCSAMFVSWCWIFWRLVFVLFYLIYLSTEFMT